MFVYLAILVISSLLQYALRPRVPAPKAATLSDFNIPVVQDGKPVAVVFGDVWVDDANILWYGGLGSQPIKKKGKK